MKGAVKWNCAVKEFQVERTKKPKAPGWDHVLVFEEQQSQSTATEWVKERVLEYIVFTFLIL